MARDIVIWRLCDGTPGHKRQSAGLTTALAAQMPVVTHEVAVRHRTARHVLDWACRVFAAGEALPDPALIVGAGRACQWPLLAARRARGGRTVCLMKPALPIACFDLALIPRHDAVRPSRRVMVTEGVLSDAQPPTVKDDALGMILVGGPSAHHAWDCDDMLAQVAQIAARFPNVRWQVTDSRRSPPATRAALAAFDSANLVYTSHTETVQHWLPRHLAAASRVWVSADSVSMIFEALSAGAAVGLLDVPARRDDRITQLGADLKARHLVYDFAACDSAASMLPAAPPLDEAGRCASLIRQRWFAHLPPVDGPTPP